jgi:hypothetical protein
MLGIGDPVRVIGMRSPDGHVAERVVHIAAVRHEPRIAQKLFADLRVEVHGSRHGMLLGSGWRAKQGRR